MACDRHGDAKQPFISAYALWAAIQRHLQDGRAWRRDN